uniref:Eukaryotic translation initiation factor 3 subunit K n=1 Tax=Pan paniscus TaxID=9597 RepID=A0A2R9B8P1_PANPA
MVIFEQMRANVVVLKLYQSNPAFFQTTDTAQIQLKALTNLPHTNFTPCKCMIGQILYLKGLLETSLFQAFWEALDENVDLLEGITGFEDSVRMCICPVVGITYQHIDHWLLAEMPGYLSDSQLKVWMRKYTWRADESQQIFICSQEENIKPKNPVEKIDFDSVSSIMAFFQ